MIEVTKQGDSAFQAQFEATGENAGFGGRVSRELHVVRGDEEFNLGIDKNTNHPSGSAVALYGYSLPIFGNVPSSSGTISSNLGAFAVCRVIGILEDGQEKESQQMELIQVNFPNFIGGSVAVGFGMDSQEDQDPEALLLAPGDGDDLGSTGDFDHLEAFAENGGYAALLAIRDTFTFNGSQTDMDAFEERLGGVEYIYYDRREGNRLFIGRRGAQVSAELGIPADANSVGNASFIFEYHPNVQSFMERNDELTSQVMVIPISVPVQTSGFGGFAPPPEGSGVAQITHSGGESGLTEWVYFDVNQNGHLIRSDPRVMANANIAAHGGDVVRQADWEPPTPGGGGGGPPGGPGGPGDGGNGGTGDGILAPFGGSSMALPLPGSVGSQQSSSGLSTWSDTMGIAEDEDFPVTKAVRSVLFFRGVMGTHSHAHDQGTNVFPVWTIFERDETAGWPGRFDQVMFFDASPASPGFPGVVHHAYRPLDHPQYAYDNGPDPLTSVSEASNGGTPDDTVTRGLFYVGLQDRLSVPYAGSVQDDTIVDTRIVPRVTKFPSGERPRSVLGVSIGGAAGGTGGNVPSAVVDETVIGISVFGGGVAGDASIGGQLIVDRHFPEGSETLEVAALVIRVMSGDHGTDRELMADPELPEDGGLLRIGREIMFYDSYSAEGHTFHVSARGLFGTEDRGHSIGEGITVMESWATTTLAGLIEGDDGALPVTDDGDFPEQGTVWLGNGGERGAFELIHYTRKFAGALSMPRASTIPGEMNAKGPGLFRGRYGTSPQRFDPGTPVILFPVRYWDRWAENADGPELHYYQFTVDQPDAYWKHVFWADEEAGHPGVELGVLARFDPEAPWDADPTRHKDLDLYWRGSSDGEPNPLGFQSDRTEFRTFVRYLPGAFNEERTAHGWKTTPRLTLFAVEYMGPGLTLRRVTR